MKYIIGVITLVVVMGVLVQYRDSLFTSYKYVREEVEVIKEVDNTPAWARDPEAMKAAEEVMKKKELEQKLKEKDAKILEAEEILKNLKTERKALASELTAY